MTTVAAANAGGFWAIAADGRVMVDHGTIVTDRAQKIRRISSVKGAAFFASAGDTRLSDLADRCHFPETPDVGLFVKQLQG